MSRILLKTVLRSHTVVSDKDTHILLHIFHLPPGLKSVGVFRVQLWKVQQILCSSRSQTSLPHFLLMYLIISWSIHLLRLCWSWVHFPSPSEIIWTCFKHEAEFGGCCLALPWVLGMIIPCVWAGEERERKEGPLGPPCKTVGLLGVQLGISAL